MFVAGVSRCHRDYFIFVGNMDGSNDVKNTKLTYAEALKTHGRGKTNEQKSSATVFDKAGKGVNKKVSFFLFNPVR